MHLRRAGTIVLTIGGLAVAGGAATARAADPGEQIARLQAIKHDLTPPERKVDSRLAVDLHNRVKAGTAEVDIEAAPGSGLVARLQALGANVRYASPRTGAIRAAVPMSKLATVAGWSEVERVHEAARAMTASLRPPESKDVRAARRAAAIRAAAAVVTSEGDVTHGADLVRARDHVTGIGTKLCVLSDGVDSLADSQAAGELPAVDILADQAGDGDEGTAMLEILHDLAPGAELGFATAFTSDASFADNIEALRFTAHCDVLVDDVLYYNESPFEDGPIAQSVNAVTADGALYFSAAGNEGNMVDGTSGTYEGDFRPSGRGIGKFAGDAHDFDPGPATQIVDPIAVPSGGAVVTLFWAEPLGHATSDYDLYLLNASGGVVDFSQDVQDGDDDPYEILGTPNATGLRLAVVKYGGEPRYFQLSALRARFRSSTAGVPAWATSGTLRGHAAAADAFATAAAPAATPFDVVLVPGDPPHPSGPFPGVFTALQAPEIFTSDGPRRMFFPAPVTRAKPDITAADGVNTSVGGFDPFFGTSAAAPHAAAIAGLVLSGNPGATTADVRDAFNATALDLAPAGVDTRTGHGLLRADQVLAYTGATPQPLVQAQAPAVTPATGDGDAYLEAGETGTLRVPVTNAGDGTATGISVTVSTGDPLATVTPRSRAYGDLPTGANTARDFTLALAPTYPLGKRVRLTVRVTFAGVLSPTTATFSIATGQPATTAQRFAYAGPPVAIPDDSALGASVPVPVTGVGYASKLTFSIDGATCTTTTPSTTVGIDHPFVADLTATLAAPDGTTARLFTGVGGNGNNLCQVVFDDGAAKLLASAPASANPFTGTWKPEQPLDGLLNGAADGTWTFHVTDDASRDTGSIRAVSLSLTGFQ
ncbi:S8 family serine peptidase [Solirubrobacter ginsenosidimutans]|uniref:S8 family serine peptidase n=1 Tax=Solirubrobacter ginsenosidimutans TaxID=490573 RepID=A0A9X3S3N1_9ACTN|nr:S8 family serine peptidase [Solirubrobacter ginsenosidimutans]MDA0164804.1 S8 family serine peptidase [Solirubrobacter ginsenosidimutans]